MGEGGGHPTAGLRESSAIVRSTLVTPPATAAQDTAKALPQLRRDLWCLGETDDAIRHCEQEYAAFRKRADPAQAVLAAAPLYFLYRFDLGNSAVGRGWLGRLARLVEEFDLGPQAGWILLIRSNEGDGPEEGKLAEKAADVARSFGDADLELCALSRLGACLMEQGRVAEGGALLDEAMAAALGGECRRLWTAVYVGCTTIIACDRAAEIPRAAQWIRASEDFTCRYGVAHLFTHCRAHYASVLSATGRWTAAERELQVVLHPGQPSAPARRARALRILADLRIAQGRLDEADRLLEGLDDQPGTIQVITRLWLARGEPATAARIVLRRLRELDHDDRERPASDPPRTSVHLERAELLELLGQAQTELCSVDAALATAERLSAMASPSVPTMITARAERALGRVHLAAHDAMAASEHLDRALYRFSRLEMPYESSRTRLLLARTSATTNPASAAAEARTALAALESLGAAPEADAAAELLRSFGVRLSRGGHRAPGRLTNREQEVFQLLAEGLSNRELARRLSLTPKTVEHHVRSVLTKLELRSRSEVAAYAVRHDPKSLNE